MVEEVTLGIECGATKSKVIVQTSSVNGDTVKEIILDFGPANYSLISDSDLTIFLQNVHDKVTLEVQQQAGWTSSKVPLKVVKVGLGMPGIVSQSQIDAVHKVVSKVWPNLKKIWIGSDIQVAFNYLRSQFKSYQHHYQLLIIAGTGSNCFGSGEDGQTVTIGGSGHILGDHGSGYAIGHNGLRSAFRQFQHTGNSPLLTAMMKHLGKDTIPELIEWSVHAGKSCVASLAKIVTLYWTEYGDDVASTVILQAIDDLSSDCQAVVENLAKKSHDIIPPSPPSQDKKGDSNILIGFTGSLLTKCPDFAEALSSSIRAKCSSNSSLDKIKRFNVNIVTLLDTDTVRGALNFLSSSSPSQEPDNGDVLPKTTTTTITNKTEEENEEKNLRHLVLPTLTSLSTTETRNSNSMNLDQMPTSQAIQLMLEEENGIYKQIAKHTPQISMLIEKITEAFKNGGRLFYVGAGTSGRLGILDASECPPTFKAPPHWVQGIIAGGSSAVFRSKEGAEDSVVGGKEAVQMKGVHDKDVVVGIAASGTTPFVWGALFEAKQRCAFAALLTFNQNLRVNPHFTNLDLLIAVNVGAEVLTGSTRLKCGTATKSILNMLTTLSMVRYGKCLENLMVDLNASNDKLRDRAARIVLTILADEKPELGKDEVTLSLSQNGYDIKKTVQLLRAAGK